MPRGDGNGPEGQGPMTGRGMGGCGGSNSQPRNPGMGGGRGAGRRQGGGQGRGLGQRIADGFNNLRQRRGKQSSRRGGSGRGRDNA